jgi:hypothetical protein
MQQPATTATSAGALCPNCRSRPADTPTIYEEPLFAASRVARVWPRRNLYSSRALTIWGKTTLCAPCAAAYRRCEALRAMGRRLTTIDFVVLFVAAVVYLFLSGQARSSLLDFLRLSSAGLVAIDALMLLTGLGMIVVGRVMRRSTDRFVRALK